MNDCFFACKEAPGTPSLASRCAARGGRAEPPLLVFCEHWSASAKGDRVEIHTSPLRLCVSVHALAHACAQLCECLSSSPITSSPLPSPGGRSREAGWEFCKCPVGPESFAEVIEETLPVAEVCRKKTATQLPAASLLTSMGFHGTARAHAKPVKKSTHSCSRFQIFSFAAVVLVTDATVV